MVVPISSRLPPANPSMPSKPASELRCEELNKDGGPKTDLRRGPSFPWRFTMRVVLLVLEVPKRGKILRMKGQAKNFEPGWLASIWKTFVVRRSSPQLYNGSFKYKYEVPANLKECYDCTLHCMACTRSLDDVVVIVRFCSALLCAHALWMILLAFVRTSDYVCDFACSSSYHSTRLLLTRAKSSSFAWLLMMSVPMKGFE